MLQTLLLDSDINPLMDLDDLRIPKDKDDLTLPMGDDKKVDMKANKEEVSRMRIVLGVSEKTDTQVVNEFKKLIDGGKVNVVRLRHLAITGKLIRDDVRSLAWKLFLGYLPPDTSAWKDILHAKREEYVKLKGKRIKPDQEDDDPNLNNPLMDEADSKWNQYFKDIEMIKTIKLDLRRTYPELSFFAREQTQMQMLNILFTWSKSHPEISYRQGMNELLAPILLINTVQRSMDSVQLRGLSASNENDYERVEGEKVSTRKFIKPSIKNDVSLELLSSAFEEDETMRLFRLAQDSAFVEHDSYVAFSLMMNSMGHFYQRDQKKEGSLPIIQKCHDIQSKLLYKVDSEYSNYLNDIGIVPQLYGLRWIRLLFSREFHIRDVCGLWDGIFSKGFEIVDFLCVAMLLYIREEVMGKDQNQALRRIMKYPPVEDVHVLILKANKVEVSSKTYDAKREKNKSLNASPVLPGPFLQEYLPSQFTLGVSSALGHINAAVNSAGKHFATNRVERELLLEIEKHEIFQNRVGLKCEKVVTKLEKLLSVPYSNDNPGSVTIKRSSLEGCLADLKLATHLLLKQVDLATVSIEESKEANVGDEELSLDPLRERVS